MSMRRELLDVRYSQKIVDGAEAGAKTDVQAKTILISTVKTTPGLFDQVVIHQQ